MRKDQKESHKDLGETELEQSVLRPIPLEANRLKKISFSCETPGLLLSSVERNSIYILHLNRTYKARWFKKKTHTQIHCGQVIYILLSCSFRLKEKKVGKTTRTFSSIQFCSVPQLCPTLCDPMNSSMPGLPVYHQLPEFTQTHVHQVGDATQPSHPLSSLSPPLLNLSQHEGLFQWVSSLHQVAKVLEFQLQHPSFQWVFRTDFL